MLPRLFKRSYARKVTKAVLDLPQGLQALDPLPAQQYSTVLQGALDNINKYPDCVVLTRVGGFYELYFNHAEQLHADLGLKRSYKDTKLGPVAMAGFPFFQLDRYLKLLVQDMNRHVAISEEFTNADSTTKNLFDRRVSRIITPGTLLDEKFMESGQHNYLLSVQARDDKVGLAWMDLSTGDFYTQESSMASLHSNIRRLRPSEVISAMNLEVPVTKVEESGVSQAWSDLVTSEFSLVEAMAGSALLAFVSTNLPDAVVTLPPVKRNEADTMVLDDTALRSLEIRRSMRDEARGSLLHAMRRTTTKSGTRLLAERLISPSTSLDVIKARLELVELFILDESLREEVKRYLKASGDAVRVLQRFSFGRGEVDDLLTITKAITATEKLRDLLQNHERAATLVKRMTVLTTLRKKISSSIDEEGLMQRNRENAETASRVMQEVMTAMTSGLERRRKAIERDIIYTMSPSASPELRKMHKNLAQMAIERDELQAKLRAETGLSTLTLKTLPGLSHFAHVKNGDAKITLDSNTARAVSATRTTKSYHFPEWSSLGSRIDSERAQITHQENVTFHHLRRLVSSHAIEIRENARVLDELDVSCSFAEIAREHDWSRPEFSDVDDEIRESSHPVVDFALRSRGLQFTKNDVSFASTKAYLITGPNMGGKSTFLRQIGVIQVLAQVGSFVPGKCKLTLKDAIYSRLGTGDSLYHNESTFYTEMRELGEVLSRATRKSLVIVDEPGRGTTTTDGVSIAAAALISLIETKCLVLCATHFHELHELVPACGTLCTDATLQGDEFSFSHKLRPGVCYDAHGLQVAELAGVPARTLEVAERLRRQIMS